MSLESVFSLTDQQDYLCVLDTDTISVTHYYVTFHLAIHVFSSHKFYIRMIMRTFMAVQITAIKL